MKDLRRRGQTRIENESLPYRASLKLRRAPFENNQQLKDIYTDPQLSHRIELLQHLVQFSDLLLIVNGPEGSGKTMLLHALEKQADKKWRIGKLNAEHILDQSALLACVAESFEIGPIAIRGELPQRVINHCKSLQLVGNYPVLLIDNAHCLDTAMLKILLYLGGSPRATLHLLRIILFSEPGVEECIVKEVLQTPAEMALVHNLEIMPFSKLQTAAYLNFRLAAAGYSGESPFSPHEVHSIYKVSRGLPVRINELAHQILLKQQARGGSGGSVTSAARQKAAWWTRWMWAVLLLIIVLILGLIGMLVDNA